MKLPVIDKSWTLFLDRDGVINKDHVGDYIRRWEDFCFEEEALEALATLHQLFGTILVVTNQRGVGLGLMSEEALQEIHRNLLTQVSQAGGRIDRIYYATDTDRDSYSRKPRPGMGWKAKEDFPDIDFEKSFMIGNNLSDMEFGRHLGMHTVYLTTTNEPLPLPHPLVDHQYKSLAAFAKAFSKH